MAVIVVIALSLLLGGGWLDQEHRRVVADVGFVLFPFLAALSCWSAASGAHEWAPTWRWIGVGALTWAAASVVWAVYELALGRLSPFPSWADVGYLGYVVPILIGLWKVPRFRERRLARLRADLDSAVIMLCLLFVSWNVVLGPISKGPTSSGLARVDALAYPGVDLLLVGVVLGLGARYAVGQRLTWSLLGLGLLTEAVTDSSYMAAQLQRTYSSGNMYDVTWVTAFLLIALAAQAPRTPGAGAGPARGERLGRALVFLPVIAAVLVALVLHPTPRGDPVAFWLGCLAALIVIVRQVVVVADHDELTADLEQMVRQRTAELTAGERRLRALVENLSDVIIVLDPRTKPLRLSYVSPSVGLAFGLSPQTLTTAEELRVRIHPDDAQRHASATEKLLAGGAPGLWRIRGRHLDGRWRHFEVSGHNLVGDDVIEGVVFVLHDVTDRQQLTQEL